MPGKSSLGILNATKAGWGAFITNGEGEPIIELSGPVVVNRNSPSWRGAEVASNNTGELSAIYYALTCLCNQMWLPPGTPAT
eukprot:4688484-Karenia_brevis.AAC.1